MQPHTCEVMFQPPMPASELVFEGCLAQHCLITGGCRQVLMNRNRTPFPSMVQRTDANKDFMDSHILTAKCALTPACAGCCHVHHAEHNRQA